MFYYSFSKIMNSKIAHKLKIQLFNYGRYLSTQQSVNRNKYHVVTYNYKNKNRFSGLCFSKYNSQKHFQYASVSLYQDSQKRNLSNNAGIQQSTEKSSELSTTDIMSQIPTENFPVFFQTFSESKIVEIAQQLLLKVHETTGLPWWASIALSAYSIRTFITLPFSILQIQNAAKLQQLKPQMEEVVKLCKMDANRAVSFHGWSESMARRKYIKDVRTEYNKLIVENNCHPVKSCVLLLIQLPVWFSFSFATRNLSYMIPRGDVLAEVTFFEMMVGGFGWVKNLTDIDHYMILPITCALLNLSIVETHLMFKDPTTITRFEKIQTYFFRFLSLIMFPIAMYVPAGTLVYWLSSSSFGLFQAFLFQSSRFNRLIGVSNLEGQPKHPYRFFYNNLKSRLHLTGK